MPLNKNIQNLLDELEASPGPTLAWTDTRERIHNLHREAETFEERGLLLNIYVTLMNSVEQMKLVTDMDAFREARRKDYNLFLVSESMDGKNVVPAKLLAVTRREIEAGHIDEDHELHKLALTGDYVLTKPPVTSKKSWWSRLWG